MSGYLLDTHIWIWVQQRNERKLSTKAFRQVEAWQKDRLAFLSPISAWEIGLLVEQGYLELGTSFDTFLARSLQDNGFIMLQLSSQVLFNSTNLKGALHRDPADRVLAASAIHLGLVLVTRDKPLLRYAREGHLKAQKLV